MILGTLGVCGYERGGGRFDLGCGRHDGRMEDGRQLQRGGLVAGNNLQFIKFILLSTR